MKKYLWIFLLIPSLCFSAAGDLETINGKVDTAITSIAGKAGTAIASICGKNYTDGDSAGDSCTGDLLFSWHAENVDVTVGTPAGCSVGDTTATANTEVSLSNVQAHDGTYSIKPTSASDYYSFSVSTEDIIKTDAGRVTGWIYNPAGNATNYVLTSYGNGSTDWIMIYLTNNNLRLSYRGSSTTQELVGPTNSITDDAWTYFVCSWSVTAVGGHYLRIGTSTDGSAPTNWTYHDTAITDLAVALASIRWGETQGAGYDHYIDEVKIYGVW